MENPAISLVAFIAVLMLVLVLGCLMDFPDWSTKTDYTPPKIKQVKRFLIIAALVLFGFLISLTGCKKVEVKPCKEEITQDGLQKILRQKLIH